MARRLGAALLPLASFATGCAGGEVQDGIDSTAIDLSADPCVDYFQYACGGFIAQNPLGDGSARVSRRARASAAMEQIETDIIDDAVRSTSADRETGLLRDYFTSCRDAGPGTQDRAALDQVIAQIDAVSTPEDLARAVAAVQDVGGDAFFSFGSGHNLTSPGTRIASVDEAGIGMPDRLYYLDDSMPWITEYHAHISALSALLAPGDPALPDAVIAVEKQLAAAMIPRDERRDPTKTFHLQDRAAFEASVPHFAWSAYFDATFDAGSAPDFTTIDVSVPDYFAALDGVLAATPLSDLQRYLRWRAMEAFEGVLGDAVVAEKYHFHDGVFSGVSTPPPRPKYCLRLTAAALAWPMSHAYVTRAFPADVGDAARAMMDDVRASLRGDLDQTPWLDASTRTAALAKLDAVRVAVGAPTQWPTLSGLVLDAGSFAGSQAALARFRRRHSAAGIGGKDDAVWLMPPATVNAAYVTAANAIDFPAAILQAPLFDASYADAVRFGAMGSVMGHELTHGFDDNGRLFDATGRLASFWTPATTQAFTERAQCVVDQYDAIEAAPGVNIDGELTLGENIADNGGVRIAFNALAPGGGDAKTFFLAYAQAWCENARPELLATLARTDPHSPPRARVNAVLANMPEFAETYGCAAGKPMAPVKRCTVW
ncbi:MAG: M13 family metallopeptidase [Minicystis sp.]